MYSLKVYAPALNRKVETKIWRFIWLVPFTFTVLWYAFVYSEGGDIEAASDLKFVLVMSVITGGVVLIDYIITLLINEQADKQELEERQMMLTLEQRHYQSLNRRIEDARRARHDLRHHLQVATAYLNDNKIEELKQYLIDYQHDLPNDNILSYCEHYTVNALVTYYAQRLMERKIPYHVTITVPGDIAISGKDLAIVFGNLLENAADAAMEALAAGKDAEVSVQGVYDGNALMLSFSNTVAKQPIADENGYFKSTKHNGSGIGISSVREVAELYNGFLNIAQEDDKFKVSVMLLNEKAA